MSVVTAPQNGAVSQAKKPATLKDWLKSDSLKNEIAQGLPKHLKPERFMRVATTALMRTPKLADCDQASFFKALLDLSQYGLEPDGRRAHLIPFHNTKRNCYEVQLIVDYKGIAELVMRSGLVSNLHADIVCENDEFEYDRGFITKHIIDFRKPRGDIYAVYCVCRLKDGTEKCDVMSKHDVELVRARSKSGRNGPWVTDWAEMAKKTVFKRLSKWLPWSSEIRDAIEHGDDEDQVANAENSPRIIETTGSTRSADLAAMMAASDETTTIVEEQHGSEAENGTSEEPQPSTQDIELSAAGLPIHDGIGKIGTENEIAARLQELLAAKSKLNAGEFEFIKAKLDARLKDLKGKK